MKSRRPASAHASSTSQHRRRRRGAPETGDGGATPAADTGDLEASITARPMSAGGSYASSAALQRSASISSSGSSGGGGGGGGVCLPYPSQLTKASFTTTNNDPFVMGPGVDWSQPPPHLLYDWRTRRRRRAQEFSAFTEACARHRIAVFPRPPKPIKPLL